MCHYHFLLASNAKDSDEIKAKKKIFHIKNQATIVKKLFI